MEFSFGIPTKIYFGKDCIAKNAGVLAAVGSKAMIVTGKHSTKASGALDDVTAVLEEEKKEYVIFDEIENNPSVETLLRLLILQGQKRLILLSESAEVHR